MLTYTYIAVAKVVCDWADAYAKARNLVSQMTDEEKNNITYGHPSNSNGCSGMTGSVPRLEFPGICLQDAGNGLRGSDMVNSYPAGIHVGASWNRDLAHARAQYMGAEFKRKGANVILGPVVGPAGRVVKGGRNWEGFGSDPYLSGILAGETVRGLQQNVIACVKHLVANEQETNRNPPALLPDSLNQSLSSNLDDKTMHELYLWAFQDAVKAGAGSVMCSYNRINNSYGCQNSKVMNGLLKGELGFQGFVVSDWTGQRSGVASANAGMDLAMPDSKYWENNTLVMAAQNGSMPQSRLDDMATRIIASWYKYAEFRDPGHGLPKSLLKPHDLVEGRDPSSKATILQSAIEGHVLVKNIAGALPLSKPKFLSLFGYDAVPPSLNTADDSTLGGWAFGLQNALTYPNGSAVNNNTEMAMFLSSTDPSFRGPGVAFNGTLLAGGGSGASTGSYIDAPLHAFQRQAYDDDTFLAWDTASIDPFVNPASDACLVLINEASSEGWDRPYLADPTSDTLVQNVAAKCSNTMVIIHNAGIRLVDEWIDNPNITAVLYAHVPGQDSGRALVEVMYGKQSPSGRLPYTVARKESDYGALLEPVVPSGTENEYYPQSDFNETVYIDYKAFIANNISPRFEFGYGLTYSNFSYANLEAKTIPRADLAYLPKDDNTVTEGGISTLWDIIAEVHCTVENIGTLSAAEVAQLYVGIPNGPVKVLRGFEKKIIRPKEYTKIVFKLTRRDLSHWDVEKQAWGLQADQYPVYVGKSVLDIQLKGFLLIP
jgi:beta-glucosidase